MATYDENNHFGSIFYCKDTRPREEIGVNEQRLSGPWKYSCTDNPWVISTGHVLVFWDKTENDSEIVSKSVCIRSVYRSIQLVLDREDCIDFPDDREKEKKFEGKPATIIAFHQADHVIDGYIVVLWPTLWMLIEWHPVKKVYEDDDHDDDDDDDDGRKRTRQSSLWRGFKNLVKYGNPLGTLTTHILVENVEKHEWPWPYTACTQPRGRWDYRLGKYDFIPGNPKPSGLVAAIVEFDHEIMVH